jgi:uncharacterized protein
VLKFALTGQPSDTFKRLRFEGQWLAGGPIIGQIDEDGRKYEITLQASSETASPEQYLGVYTFPSGRAVGLLAAPSFTIQNRNLFPGAMVFSDFETGAIRGVYPTTADTFLIGGARGVGYPFAAQITFDRNGSTAVAGLIWRELDPLTGQLIGQAETGTRLEARVETVHYASTDGTPLVGQLTLPDTPGPHPALIMLHGSEPGRRNGFGQQLLSAFALSRGLATLTYDKRGVGDSGGTYRESADGANLKLLAQDAAAGVEYLAGRPDISVAQIGLIGGSQAGWVIPLAAAESAHVAFFVIRSGPLVSVGHETLYSSYANDGESLPRLTAEEISKQLARFPPSGFDPRPVLKTLPQAGLWLWGDQDKSVPVPESLRNLEVLIAAAQTNCSYHLFPGADHNLQRSTQGLLAELPSSTGFPEDYYSILTQWLLKQLQ